MIIYIVGLNCVGKSTIGKMLAEKLGYSFFDLDNEVEIYYQKTIERLQNELFSMNEFRRKASIVLDKLFEENIDSVISGTASGLMFYYLNVFRKHKKNKKLYSIYLHDSPENILQRLTFYDIDSKLIDKKLDDYDKKNYLKCIKADYNYFKESYKRSDFNIDITDMNLIEIPDLIINELEKTLILDIKQHKT